MVMDIPSLQNALDTNITNTVTSGVQDQFEKLLAWVLVPSIVLTAIMLIMYIAHLVHRHKIDKAIIEIRDTVRELKLAQAAQLPKPEPVAEPTHNIDAPTGQTDQST